MINSVISSLFLFLVQKLHYLLDRKKGSFHLKSNFYLFIYYMIYKVPLLFKSYIAVYKKKLV